MIAIKTRNELKHLLMGNQKRFSGMGWTKRLKETDQNKADMIKKTFSTTSYSNLTQNDILDEHNLLKFDTLHDLQVNASLAFSDNPLFGTFTETKGRDPSYEWMKYGEFGDKVTACRAVLKDLGMIFRIMMLSMTVSTSCIVLIFHLMTTFLFYFLSLSHSPPSRRGGVLQSRHHIQQSMGMGCYSMCHLQSECYHRPSL